MPIRFVLHRPRNSKNIGAAARALANTGAGALWIVEPEGYDRAEAARLAAGADEVLERMRVVRTLDEAIADCADVVMTSGREVPGALDPAQTAARLLSSGEEVALIFGDEVRGLTNRELRRGAAIATIPTAEKSSLNLAQAVLLFGWEIFKARGHAPLPVRSTEPPATEEVVGRLRAKSQALLLEVGFLNPQQPETVLEELILLLRRAQPSRREVEMLLAACDQLVRVRR